MAAAKVQTLFDSGPDSCSTQTPRRRGFFGHTGFHMHNLLTRLNNASAFLSSCMMALVFAISLSSFLFTADPKGDLSISSIKVCVIPDVLKMIFYFFLFHSLVYNPTLGAIPLRNKTWRLFNSISRRVSLLQLFTFHS
jgi:hypothetical protein